MSYEPGATAPSASASEPTVVEEGTAQAPRSTGGGRLPARAATASRLPPWNPRPMPGPPSRRSRGTRRGRSSGGRPAPATATPSAWSAAGAAWSSRCSTYRSRTGVPADGHIADRLLAVPFRQVRERGFEAHDDGTPLVVVDVETELEFSVEEVVGAIDDTGVEFADRGGFDTDDEEYGKLVEAIIRDEIGQGEGANLVIGRHYRATVADWGADKALTVLQAAARARARRLLDLPLLHRRPLPDRRQPRAARLDPRRRRPDEPDQRHLPAARASPAPTCSGSCSTSSHDEKEIYELFMVVDEELKMMCDICHEGGQVLGPFLKPMSRLVHTEYLLAGRTDRDPREVLRDTMYAATVTGSPGRERLPADQAVRVRGPRLLRRRAGGPRPRRRGRPGRRQPDRDPHRGRRPRRPAHRHRRRDAGARLRPGVRGGRDARQGRRDPQRLRAGAARRRRRTSTSPSWSTTRTCCSPSTRATGGCRRSG